MRTAQLCGGAEPHCLLCLDVNIIWSLSLSSDSPLIIVLFTSIIETSHCCSAKFTQIILLQVTLFVLPAEVWMAEVHASCNRPVNMNESLLANSNWWFAITDRRCARTEEWVHKNSISTQTAREGRGLRTTLESIYYVLVHAASICTYICISYSSHYLIQFNL